MAALVTGGVLAGEARPLPVLERFGSAGGWPPRGPPFFVSSYLGPAARRELPDSAE